MRLYFFIGICFVACNTKQNQADSVTAQNNEIRKMILEDSFDIDTSAQWIPETLSNSNKNSILQLTLKPLKPNQNLKDLTIENVEDVYLSLLKTTKKYADSSEEKQLFLDSIFGNLEDQNEILQQNKDYPIELKLKIASIKSDLHFLHSNRRIKPKS